MNQGLEVTRACLIAAPGTGHGKTWLTAALARRCVREGRRVRVLKTGPDFIDPAILARASRAPVYNLDPWMAGDADCHRQLAEAARSADIVLVEGMMGLFDGKPSSADLAQRFGLPVLLVIDASAMAQTFGALVHGLVHYRPELRFVGAFASRVAGPGHAEMLSASVSDRRLWCGALRQDSETTLPERQLGLVMPSEIEDLEARLDRAADALLDFDLNRLPKLELQAQATPTLSPGLRGVRIAVASDAAFCFVYPANLDLLRALGAQLIFFSPCNDAHLPDANALYLPGGYPELHAATLSANVSMLTSIRAHIDQGKPTLAECGGLMLLAKSLRTLDGQCHEMAGVLELDVQMQQQLAAIGHYSCTLAEGSLRGHSFHYSRAQTSAPHAELATSPHGGRPEPIYRKAHLLASYVHWYLPSDPDAAVRLLS